VAAGQGAGATLQVDAGRALAPSTRLVGEEVAAQGSFRNTGPGEGHFPRVLDCAGVLSLSLRTASTVGRAPHRRPKP
jgi:hypothetical protein